MEATSSSGMNLLKTIRACLLAPIIWALTTIIAGGFYYITNTLFTVIRPGVIQFFSVIISTIIGMYAARLACDSWLKGYSPQVVFIIFGLFCVAAAVLEFFLLPLEWSKISTYLEIFIMGGMAYVMFWQYAPLD